MTTPIVIRHARPDDAPRLVTIRSSVIEHDLGDEEFVHHLGIPHGDDYFCLVAQIATDVVGYLSAGGSRDDDHKSYGEFYECAVDPTSPVEAVLAALTDAGFAALVDAQYGGVIAWVADSDTRLLDAVVSLGFVADPRVRSHREDQRRLGVTILPAKLPARQADRP